MPLSGLYYIIFSEHELIIIDINLIVFDTRDITGL